MSQKLRMDGRDYSRAGWYFLTLGADYHRHYFGRVEGGEMRLNDLGRLVERCWAEVPLHYDHVELGAWQVMPNHFHGLIRIVRPGGKGLGEVVNVFKGAVTREWRRGLLEGSRYSGKESEKPGVWAPNYYDVICFDAEELAVRERYVRDNPRRWALRDVRQGRFEGGVYKGNLRLLKSGVSRRVLRVSRRASDAEIDALMGELAVFDGVVISTFYSAGERACLKRVLAGSAGVVWVVPTVLPESIPVVWAGAFIEGRALWVSRTDLPEASRMSCEEANRFAESLANGR
jgi:putative transposase